MKIVSFYPNDYKLFLYLAVYPTYILTRSKQEIRTSLAEVNNFIRDFPNCWARTLLFYAYSLWYLQLPSMIHLSRNKIKMLRLGFRVSYT
jgi:hypothetical protein